MAPPLTITPAPVPYSSGEGLVSLAGGTGDSCGGRVAQDVGEIAIKGHEGAPFGRSDGKQSLIIRARQLLISRESDIVARCSEKSRDAVGHILVELHGSHDQAVTGTMLSRAKSAA